MCDLRIAILTTETPHHIYFIKEISTYFELTGIAVETEALTPLFDAHHPFEDERDRYEKLELLKGEKVKFNDFCQTRSFKNINDNDCISFISDLNPDVIVTFGTGIVRKPLIRLCPNGFVNLHGGNPERYRGLDTHLWAIYHSEFDQLIVAFHLLNSKLDDGEIIQQAPIQLTKNSKLYELRSENTRLCVQLAISGLAAFNQLNTFISTPQQKKGRYYSFMPKEIKEICVRNYDNYVMTL